MKIDDKTYDADLPFVSVVIPARNAAKTLPACLHSLNGLNYPMNRREILVIDGGSTDATKTIAEQYGAKVIPNPRISIATGRELGVEKAKGALIAFTDADCILHLDWLKRSVEYLSEGTVVGITGPIHIPEHQNAFGRAVGYIFDLATRMGSSTHAKFYTEVQDTDDFPSCNAIYRRDALIKVMPLDEDLYSGSDVAINYQLRQLGYRLLWVPDVEVWHEKRSTPKGFWRQMVRYAIGRVQLGKRWKPLLKISHVLTAWVPMIWGFVAILLAVTNPRFFWAYVVATLMALLGVAFVAGWQMRSLRVALWTPLACGIFAGAWSYGFWREWLFPRHGPGAN
ncbi:glycosyltransferase [Candidatus Poribacteria bacterium]|nr:glycosyltransferase [Candidatus Poribacteria bacterium]